jgi:hypothetical protein
MTHDPFEETSDVECTKERAKRSVAKYYVVKEVVYEASTARQVNDYLRDNYAEGLSIVKGFHSLPRRKESFEF